MASTSEHNFLATTWTLVGLIILAILGLYFFKIMLPALTASGTSSKTASEQGAGTGTTGTGTTGTQGGSGSQGTGSNGNAGSSGQGAGGTGGTGGNVQVLPSVTVPTVTLPHIPGL